MCVQTGPEFQHCFLVGLAALLQREAQGDASDCCVQLRLLQAAVGFIQGSQQGLLRSDQPVLVVISVEQTATRDCKILVSQVILSKLFVSP